MASASSVQNQQWLALSQEFANAIEKVSGAIVAVHGGGRLSASGIYWRPGLIVTSSHGIRREEQLSITLPDKSSAEAALVGRDPSTDVALLKVEKTSLSTVETTSTTELKVGHVVLAVGRSRLGDTAASSGVVARLGDAWRTWRGGEIDQLIRPDITLYRGQAGSALLNARGQVLGMNSEVLARRAAITVPSATVDRVIAELLEHGHIRRPYLGLAMQPVELPQNIQQKLKLNSPTGLLVVHVEAEGPGGEAGLMLGDIIVRIQERQIGELSDLQEVLRGLRSGDTAKLAIVRGGEARESNVTVGERPRRT